MITLTKNKQMYIYKKYIFATKEEFLDNKVQADIVEAFYCDIVPDFPFPTFSTKTYSAITNLNRDIDDIRGDFTKTIRNEILRAEKEAVSVTVFSSNDILANKTICDLLHNRYLQFCHDNNYESIIENFKIDEIKELSKTNNTVVTKALFDSGEVYHVYYCNEENTMLAFSFSVFIGSINDKSSQGRANKYLHYRDMEYFSNKGLNIYDWGGLFDPENPNGIDRFKLSFGSKPRDAYKIFRANSLKGKMLLMAYICRANIMSREG